MQNTVNQTNITKKDTISSIIPKVENVTIGQEFKSKKELLTLIGYSPSSSDGANRKAYYNKVLEECFDIESLGGHKIKINNIKAKIPQKCKSTNANHVKYLLMGIFERIAEQNPYNNEYIVVSQTNHEWLRQICNIQDTYYYSGCNSKGYALKKYDDNKFDLSDRDSHIILSRINNDTRNALYKTFNSALKSLQNNGLICFSDIYKMVFGTPAIDENGEYIYEYKNGYKYVKFIPNNDEEVVEATIDQKTIIMGVLYDVAHEQGFSSIPMAMMHNRNKFLEQCDFVFKTKYGFECWKEKKIEIYIENLHKELYYEKKKIEQVKHEYNKFMQDKAIMTVVQRYIKGLSNTIDPQWGTKSKIGNNTYTPPKHLLDYVPLVVGSIIASGYDKEQLIKSTNKSIKHYNNAYKYNCDLI